MADLDWTKLTAKLEADARQDVAEAKEVYERAKSRLTLLETLRSHLSANHPNGGER